MQTLLQCRATPRRRPSMTASAWWSTLVNWAGGFTRMKTKLRQVGRCFSQARSIRRSYGHDSSSSQAQRIGLLEPLLSCLAYSRSCLPAADVQHVMSDEHAISNGSAASHILPSLGWSYGTAGEAQKPRILARSDGVYVLKKRTPYYRNSPTQPRGATSRLITDNR